MNRRTVTVILLLVLLAVTAAPGAARADSSSLKVSVSDSYPGDAPQYTLSFVSAVTLQKGEALTLTFDQGTGRGENGWTVPASTLTLDGTAVTTDARWSGTQLTLTVPLDLPAGTEHTLTISEDAGIQNPWTAGHDRITLGLPDGTAITSNYYTVTTETQLVPLGLHTITENGQTTGICLQFRTGRNGALVGHDLVRNAQGLMVYPDNEDTLTVRLSAELSALWATSGTATLQPNYAESPFFMTVLSNTVYDTDENGHDLRQLVLNLPHNIPANAQLALSLFFAPGQKTATLSDQDYVRVYTSKEPTLITIPPQTGSGTGSGEPGGTGSTDTTPPAVTWSFQEDPLLPRLYTLTITIREDHLQTAYLATGEDGWLHTYLATGNNTIMLINRGGIKGTIHAVDQAGNTTDVPVEIKAP